MSLSKFPIGSMVMFDWWTVYRAPSTTLDHRGHSQWYDLTSGDSGIVISHCDDGEHLIVLFSRHNMLLRVHHEMLTCCSE
jgi:hypothetical protein